MYKKIKKNLTFVLYDGISNSVFSSQVLHPLLIQLQENKNLEIVLVSFEKTRPSNNYIMSCIPAHERFHFVLCRKLPFFGKLSLKFAAYQFKKLLTLMPTNQIICRGPLAGWVALKALQKIKQKPQLTIQARGLCAQEYRFAHQNLKENFFKKFLRKFIYNKLNQIEFEVYQKQPKKEPVLQKRIESVSPALKDYLVANFKAHPTKFDIAHKDIPPKIKNADKQKWQAEIREKLNIPHDYTVYCYSGSAKPWQCIVPSINYFLEQYKKNPKSFLLILSQDKKMIEPLLIQNKVPAKNYYLTSVKSEELNLYLSACNAGLLFREKDIINWVSRPTKMLEYQAVGLNIIHNNTVAWLENSSQNQI